MPYNQIVDGDGIPYGTTTNPLNVSDPSLSAFLSAQGALVVQPLGGTLTSGSSGTLYSNEGATAISPFVLPTAVAGLRFGFIVQDADGIRVTASAGDTIQIVGSVSGVAGKIESTTIGSTIYLMAINATQWVALYDLGTWVVT